MKRLSKRRKEVLRGYGVETILEKYKPFARKIKRLAPHEELQPYKHGQLSARQAKKNTREASIVDGSSSFYYNMKENWIDDCHHSVATTDMHANNLIEIDPDTNASASCSIVERTLSLGVSSTLFSNAYVLYVFPELSLKVSVMTGCTLRLCASCSKTSFGVPRCERKLYTYF